MIIMIIIMALSHYSRTVQMTYKMYSLKFSSWVNPLSVKIKTFLVQIWKHSQFLPSLYWWAVDSTALGRWHERSYLLPSLVLTVVCLIAFETLTVGCVVWCRVLVDWRGMLVLDYAAIWTHTEVSYTGFLLISNN